MKVITKLQGHDQNTRSKARHARQSSSRVHEHGETNKHGPNTNYKQIHEHTDIISFYLSNNSTPHRQQTAAPNSYITSNQITPFFVHVPPTRTVSKLVLLLHYWPSSFCFTHCLLLNQPIFNKQ